MDPSRDYCSFTKAVEHLGDRWSLLIARELAMGGSLGFNALAARLPGISRSVLARRLRKLEDLGLIERAPGPADRMAPPHRLAPAGRDLVPTLLALKDWSDRWLPEDPAMAERDPSVIVAWLARRVDREAAPNAPVVIEFAQFGPGGGPLWLVVERDAEPSLCLTDPGLPPERYVYVEAEPAALLPVSRGDRRLAQAVSDRSVALYGDPVLTQAMSGWFGPAKRPTATPTPIPMR
jgi:DNA-binding HxlR family transcriptional regulator